MSARKKADNAPSRREALLALESMCMALALWHASLGTGIEPLCEREVRLLAERIYKTMRPQGMLAVQQGLEALLKRTIQDDGTGTYTVVDVPVTARQERDLPGEQAVAEGEVALPQSRGREVENGAEGEVARGLRAVVDQEG